MIQLNKLTASKQEGAVLVVALIILLMVSVLGLSAMRASIYSTKVSAGIQADTMTFDAAESAIAMSMYTLRPKNPDDGADKAAASQNVAALMRGEVRQTCMQPDGTLEDEACGISDHMDSRGLLRAGSYMVHKKNNCRMVAGNDVETYRDYVIYVLGESDMQSYGIENNHLQEALQLGLNCIEI